MACHVEIFGQNDQYIAFDFGDFAVVVSEKSMNTFFDEEYTEQFMEGICSFEFNRFENMTIPQDAFERIKLASQNWSTNHGQTESQALIELLLEYFPDYVAKA